MKIIAISLLVWLALWLTFANIDVVFSRITTAIRGQDIKWSHSWGKCAFYWALFILCCLI